MAKAYNLDTGERLALVDLRGRGSKARSRKNREGRFGLMYKAECAEGVITSKNLSHFEARLAIFMFVRTDWENNVRMSQEEIATAMHVPASQISRTIKQLIEHGIIRLVSRGVFEVNPKYFWMGEDDEREYAVKERAELFKSTETE